MKTFNISLFLRENHIIEAESEDAAREQIIDMITESKFYKNICIEIKEAQDD